jgi:hypothetical protein
MTALGLERDQPGVGQELVYRGQGAERIFLLHCG